MRRMGATRRRRTTSRSWTSPTSTSPTRRARAPTPSGHAPRAGVAPGEKFDKFYRVSKQVSDLGWVDLDYGFLLLVGRYYWQDEGTSNLS